MTRPTDALHRPLPLLGSALLCALLAACGGSDDDEPAPVDARPACTALATMTIPAAGIGLPTGGAVVQSADLVAADASGNALGEYCAVQGVVRPANAGSPDLQFQVNLPSAWNRKAVQLGGGGFDGTLVTGLGPAGLQPSTVRNPLAQGYATLGSDGGHQGGPGFDGRFGLDDEALLNYGQQSVKKTHDVAMAILRERYGQAPRRFYFVGNSQGGHEALDAAARYGADYDGVVSNYPAYNVTLLHLGSLNAGRAVYDDAGAGWLSPAKTKLVTDAVYAACDGLDGAADGVISNVAGCDAAFGIAGARAALRCAGGVDAGDGCLSDAQLDAVERIASPYRPGFAIAGMDEFPRWPLLEGARFQVSNFGTRPVPANPPTGEDALLYNAGAATTQYIITRDPALDPLAFDPLAWQARTQQVGTIMDVTDVPLTTFRNRGGKMILLHGTADDFITPHNTVAYYERHQAQQGGRAAMDAFVRFYVVPGLGHGFGPFNAKYDGLGELDRWVEGGPAPEVLTAVDGNAGANRSRPMCLYPTWPKFTGAAGASLDDARHFSCVTP